jgi:hypothetical protein
MCVRGDEERSFVERDGRLGQGEELGETLGRSKVRP